MIAIAFLLALAGAPDCSRYRDYDLQPCEVERDRNDILDAAGRPPVAHIGDHAMRFSTRPALGGRAVIVEIAASGRGARVQYFILRGHPRDGWKLDVSRRFNLGSEEFDRLAGQIDRAFLSYHPPVPDPDNGETIICMDGPGYLTERVRRGRVDSLAGFCPPSREEEHANVRVACAIDQMISRHVPVRRRPEVVRGERCARAQPSSAP